MSERTYMNPADEEFFAAIGRLAISWAHIETGLDFMIAVIYHNLGGHEIEEKPWSLSRKLKFLRKCFSRFESLARLKEICCPLLHEIAAASDMRQKIIHGFIISHQEGTGEATMIQLLRGAAPNAHIQFTVTALDILRAASAAADLGKRSLGIGTLLLEVRAELLDKFNQTTGKIPS